VKKKLSTLLWSLAKGIVEKVEEHKANDQLIQTRTLYFRNEVTDFKYDKGSTGFGQSFASIEKEEWDWRDQFGFIERVVKGIPEYSVCVAEISRRCQVNENQADFWVTRFVQFVISKIVTGNVDDEFLVDLVAIFLADLENSPVDWQVKVWLRGVWLEDERYEIKEGITLRRPNPSDFETETRFELWPMQSSAPGTLLGHFPSAILESVHRASNQQEIQREISAILDTMRLFKLGSVTSEQTIISAQSILRIGTTQSLGRSLSNIYKYGLTADNVTPLQIFLDKMLPLLSSISESTTPHEGSSPISIALARFKDALLQQTSIESRITSAITCFEALYLKPKERMELAHRLSQRVSTLLRLLGFTPLKAYNELNQAYEIRSTFIHGSQIDSSRQKSATQLCETIMDYARISLVVFLQIQDTTEKKALIGKLDNALLDENALAKVRELLKDNLLIPGLASH
jgi:hypothetical protein